MNTFAAFIKVCTMLYHMCIYIATYVQLIKENNCSTISSPTLVYKDTKTNIMQFSKMNISKTTSKFNDAHLIYIRCL